MAFGGCGLLTVNLDVPVLDAQRTRIFFLPDKMLTVTGAHLGSLSYADLRV